MDRNFLSALRRDLLHCNVSSLAPECRRLIFKLEETIGGTALTFIEIGEITLDDFFNDGGCFFVDGLITFGDFPSTRDYAFCFNQSRGVTELKLSKDSYVYCRKYMYRDRRGYQNERMRFKIWVCLIDSLDGELTFVWCERGPQYDYRELRLCPENLSKTKNFRGRKSSWKIKKFRDSEDVKPKVEKSCDSEDVKPKVEKPYDSEDVKPKVEKPYDSEEDESYDPQEDSEEDDSKEDDDLILVDVLNTDKYPTDDTMDWDGIDFTDQIDWDEIVSILNETPTVTKSIFSN